MKTLSHIAAFCIAMLACGAAAATPLDVSSVTNNNAGNVSTLIGVLSLDLSDNGDGTASLTVTMNNSSAADGAVVEQIFLDSEHLTVPIDISFASGGIGNVDFELDSSAGNLPGGNTVSFSTDASTSADNPAPRRGIGWHNQDQTAGQSGVFTFGYNGAYADLFADLSQGGIGMHVIAFGDGGSESFVTTQIPEPATIALLGAGVGAAALARRRRNRKSA